MSAEQPKKKRRQNVACDCCKLRRVKCDLLTLLTSLPSSSSLAEEDTPLNVLVETYPEIGCTNCKNKKVKCTTQGIVNPAKPNKSGKRIDEARRVYGLEGQDQKQASTGPGLNTNPFDGYGHPRSEGNLLMGMSSGVPLQMDMATSIGMGQAGNTDSSLPWTNFNFDPNANAIQPANVDLGPAPMDIPPDEHGIDKIIQDLLNCPPPPDLLPLPDTNIDNNTLFDLTNLSAPQDPFPPVAFPLDTFLNNTSMVQPQSQWSPPPAAPVIAEAAPPPLGQLPPPTTILPATSGSPQFDAMFAIWDELNASRHALVSEASSSYRETPNSSEEDGKWEEPMPEGLTLEIESVDNVRAGIPRYVPPMTREHRTNESSALSQRSSVSHSQGRQSISQPPSSNYSSFSLPQDLHSLQGRKRHRSPSQTCVDSDGGGKKVSLSDDENPWRIWAPKDSTTRLVRWSRREEVQEDLADRTLGQALSQNLVHTFFQAAYLSYPAISAESFYTAWTEAGQMSDRMTPAQEVLCAVIEAWGSRYSDSPAVLGLSPSKAHAAPKVIKADGTFIPGTQARAHWGRARLNVCNALLKRAGRLVDESGILHKPSITGLQALTLYIQMLHMTDELNVGNDHWMRTQMVHRIAQEQMELLGLMWTSTDIVVHQEDEATSMPQLRLKQRRLFWTHMIGDGFFSAASNNLPRIPQEDVDAASIWLKAVESKLPESSLKAVAFFIKCYHKLGVAARELAIKVAYPGRRKGTIDPEEFCKHIRKIWNDVNVIVNELDSQAPTKLSWIEKDDPIEFSPLNFMVNLRLSTPLLLLVTHQHVEELLQFRKVLKSAYISSAAEESMTNNLANTSVSGSASNSPDSDSQNADGNGENKDAGVTVIDQLHKQSVDVVLQACRAQIPLVKALLPSGMLQSASVFVRDLHAMAKFLAVVPTNEQGYPSNTPGGLGWTWDVKQKEIQVLIDSLYQVGWAWSDVADVLDFVMVTMERLTPSEEVLEKWRSTHEQNASDETVAKGRREMMERGQAAIDSAFKFWPPIRTPSARTTRALQENAFVTGESEGVGAKSPAEHRHAGFGLSNNSSLSNNPLDSSTLVSESRSDVNMGNGNGDSYGNTWRHTEMDLLTSLQSSVQSSDLDQLTSGISAFYDEGRGDNTFESALKVWQGTYHNALVDQSLLKE